jgi:hypothetical protein
VCAKSRRVTEISAVNCHEHRISVEFYWLGDRYGHSISVVKRGDRRVVLESIEGDNTDFWPPSPALQELGEPMIVSDSNQVQTTMLVGAAGKNHWAMCVSPRDHSNDVRDFQPELVFDIACRIKDPPVWLGNSYHVHARATTISEEPQRANVPADSPLCFVVPENVALEIHCEANGRQTLRCAPELRQLHSVAETVRWRFAVRLHHE